MNNLTVFDNPEFGKVRTLEDNGKPLFCGVDIARALGYSNPRDALARHCKGVVKHDGVTAATKKRRKIMNKLTVFTNSNFGEVRTIEKSGEPWFVAADVCRALELGNPTMAVARLDEDERTLISIEGASNGKPVNAVNEPGLYALVFASRKKEARQFKRWITHEVLPALRRTGTYSVSPDKQSRADAMLRNAKSREAALWLKMGEQVAIPEYKQICAHYASGVLNGTPVLPLPEASERYYTAAEVGEMLGVTEQKVGSIANANGLKTPEYGKWYHDKSPHSPKEVDTFKYNAQAVEKFKQFLA